MELLVATYERPHIVAVATRVVGEEAERVHAFAGEVVQSADQRLALGVFPGRVARREIPLMRLPRLQRGVRLRSLRVVEVRICQQRLRRVGANFQEILFRSGELEEMFSHILQSSMRPEVAALFVGPPDREASSRPIERLHCRTAAVERYVLATRE